MSSSAGSSGAGDTDVKTIPGLQADACPFASWFGIDHLNLNIEIIRFLDIGHGDLVVAVPFFSTTIQDVEPGLTYRHNLPRPDRHARFRPFDGANGKAHISLRHGVVENILYVLHSGCIGVAAAQ